MKLSKIIKNLLCLSLLFGGVVLIPKGVQAQQVEPYVMVREINVNKTKDKTVSVKGYSPATVFIKLYGKFIETRNPDGIQNWDVVITIEDRFRGEYEVSILDYEYRYGASGPEVTVYLLVEVTKNHDYAHDSITINL